MQCLTCGEQMKCYNDVNDISVRIDWEQCPKCGSWSQIEYNSKGQQERVLWLRDKPKERTY